MPKYLAKFSVILEADNLDDAEGMVSEACYLDSDGDEWYLDLESIGEIE